MQETPTNGLIPVVAEALQELRDMVALIVVAKKVDHIINAVTRLPTVLLKSYDPKSNLAA